MALKNLNRSSINEDNDVWGCKFCYLSLKKAIRKIFLGKTVINLYPTHKRSVLR